MAFLAWSNSIQEGRPIDQKYIYNTFGCKGKNISPSIEWSNEPKDTKSFALTMHDPDAPHEGGWLHWAVVNIPGSIHGLSEGASNERKLPQQAKELKTTYGDAHYGGPCPPKGAKPHHYVFTVYALKDEFKESDYKGAPEKINSVLEKNALEKASFTVEYGRE